MAVDAGSIYSEVRVKLDKLKGDLNKVETQFNKFGKQNKQQTDKVQKGWKKGFSEINLAGVAAFAGLTLVVKNAIGTFADFEQALANVKSVAGATDEEFERLEQAAKSAGEETRFSASEAADALYNLASAGLDATESAAALDGVLQLAGATQSDLASTSATVTATLSQYGLEAGEATRVSNVFAAAIGNSQANMGKLSNAFRQVGPVAASVGLSLEETTGALQALFDAGFKGEQAGTALRNVLGSLANQADPTVQKLEALGLTFEELNPSTNDFASIIGTIAEAGLETGDVIAAFGKEAGPQLLSLLRTGEEGLREYEAAVTGTEAAAEAYATQNDTLQGSFDQLKSTVEAAKISFVEELAPGIRAGVDILREFIKQIVALPGPVKLAIGVVAAGIPIVTGVTIAIKAMIGALGAALGPISAVVAAVGVFTAAVAAGIKEVNKLRAARIEEAFGDIGRDADTTAANVYEIAKGIQVLQTAFKFTSKGSLTVFRKAIKNLAENLGITEQQVVEVAKSLEGLDETTQEHLATIEEQIKREEGYQAMASGRVAATKEIQAAEERAAQAEKDRAKEKLAAQVEYEEAVKFAQELQRQNLVTVKETTETEIGLTQDLLEKLVSLNKQDTELFKTLKSRLAVLESEYEQIEENARAAEEAAKAREQATDKVQGTLESYQEKIEEVGKSEDDLREIQKQRVLQEIDTADTSIELRDEAKKAVIEYYETLDKYLAEQKEEARLEELRQKNRELADAVQGYQDKLVQTFGTEEQIRDLERERALEQARAYEGDADRRRELIRLVTEYYDQLERREEEAAAEAERIKALEDERKAREALSGIIVEYTEKTRELNSTEQQLIQIERERVLESVESWELAADKIDEAKQAVNQYYDAVEDRRAQELIQTELQEISDATEQYREQLDSLTKTEEELLDVEEQRAIDRARELATTEEAKEQLPGLIQLITDVYQAKRDEAEATRLANEENENSGETYTDISDKIKTYREKLEDLNASNRRAIELEFEREVAAIRASGASEEAQKEAIAALVEYYGALIRKTKEAAAEQEKVLRAEAIEKFKSDIISATETAIDFMNVWASGDITDILSEAGDQLLQLGQQTGNVYLMIAGVVAKAASEMVESVQRAHEEVVSIRMETEQITRDAIRDRMQWEYEQQIAHINSIETERIDSIRRTLSAEVEQTLIELGVLEESRSQYYDRIYQDAINSIEGITEAEKEQIREILEAQEEAEEARAKAEEQYRRDMAQWQYDQAVFERDLAIEQVQIDWQKARADLGWLGSITHGAKLDAAYNEMIQAIQNTPLPPPPEFQTGGLVMPQTGGQLVRVAENNAPELMLNGGPEGEAFLNNFASRIAGMMSGGKSVTIQLDVDGKRIAENTASYYNNGKVRLKV